MADDPVMRQLEREWEQALDRLSAFVSRPRRRGPPDVTVIVAELEDVRLQWAELRASGVLAQYAGRYITAEWTLRDLLAHMASWSTEFDREVETVARGERFDYAIPFAMSVMGPNQWNQVEVDRRRERSLDEILDEFESRLRRLEEQVLALPPETLYAEAQFPMAPTGDPAARSRGSIAQITLVRCGHDRYHLERIRQFVEAQEG